VFVFPASFAGHEGLAMAEITGVIDNAQGAEGVAVDALWPAAYGELKTLARLRIREVGPARLIDTTALVHESWLKLSSARFLKVENRYQFFAYASKVMRSVIVDIAKEQQRQKRGGGIIHVDLDASLIDGVAGNEPLKVDEALIELEKFEPRLTRIVEMRYFGGLTETETGEVLGLSSRTIRRDWEKARLLLRDMLAD
jgi:RNA polymerase sigma factor (TIGR02999 family)